MINKELTQEKFSNYFIKEILLCGNKLHLIIGILLAVFKSIAFYIIVFLQNKNEPLEVTMIYSGLGDIQYYQFLPYIGSFKFGESQVYENLNQGLVGFTLPSIFLHSFLFANLGIVGFILANIIIIYLFYCFLLATLKLTGIPNILAFSITALLTSGYYVHTFFEKILNIPNFNIWDERFPRPFISGVILIITIHLLIILISQYNFVINSKFYWILLGVFTSLLFQADFSCGFTIMLIELCYLLAGLAVGLKIINSPLLLTENSGNFFRNFQKKNFVSFVVSFIIASIPLFLQQLVVSLDVKRRFGLFPVKKIVFLDIQNYQLIILGLLLFLIIINLVLTFKQYKKINLEKVQNLSPEIMGVLLIICGYLALPIFLLIFHKGIQLEKFIFCFNISVSYAVLITICSIIKIVYSFFKTKYKLNILQKNNKYIKLIIYSLILILSLKSISVIYISRNMQTNNVRFKFSPEYRQDYASLIREINKDTYKKLKVMGTLDHQTQIFWQTFKQGNSYVPDLFLSTLSDEETELRLIKLAKIIGMNKDDFREFIIDKKEPISPQSLNWFGLAKYQTNEQYLLNNINDYTTEQIKSMKKHSILNPLWNLIIPQSEQKRIMTKFNNTKVESLDNPRLDFIVLTNDSFFNSFAPNNNEFKLVFENKTFRMWVKNKRT